MTKAQMKRVVIAAIMIDLHALYINGTTAAHGVGSLLTLKERKARQAKLSKSPKIQATMKRVANGIYKGQPEIRKKYEQMFNNAE